MNLRHVVLARWSCDIVQNSKCLEVLTTQKIFAEFARFQFRLILNVFEVSDSHARTNTLHRFSKLLSKVAFYRLYQVIILIIPESRVIRTVSGVAWRKAFTR